jgi:hypothetical protein
LRNTSGSVPFAVTPSGIYSTLTDKAVRRNRVLISRLGSDVGWERWQVQVDFEVTGVPFLSPKLMAKYRTIEQREKAGKPPIGIQAGEFNSGRLKPAVLRVSDSATLDGPTSRRMPLRTTSIQSQYGVVDGTASYTFETRKPGLHALSYRIEVPGYLPLVGREGIMSQVEVPREKAIFARGLKAEPAPPHFGNEGGYNHDMHVEVTGFPNNKAYLFTKVTGEVVTPAGDKVPLPSHGATVTHNYSHALLRYRVYFVQQNGGSTYVAREGADEVDNVRPFRVPGATIGTYRFNYTIEATGASQYKRASGTLLFTIPKTRAY